MIGFYGKIPANGDFVQNGLPRSLIDAWDEWMQDRMAASRSLLGEAWTGLWMEAPIWRFQLAKGLCGPAAVSGVWMPSVDRVGRVFPLMFASPDGNIAWFDAAEAIGLAALEQELTPQTIVERLVAVADQPAASARMSGTIWWTEGAPSVAGSTRQHVAMPTREEFAAMLTDAGFPGR